MSEYITIHEDMQGKPDYANPNVYTVNAQGQKVSPQHGVECYFQAKIQNTGTENASQVQVRFFLCEPGANGIWPENPHGVVDHNTIAPGPAVLLTCDHKWKPDSTKGAHQCIVAVISCFGCPEPPTTPGERVDKGNRQIGQHNVSIAPPNTSEDVRYFNVLLPEQSGYTEIVREPLAKNTAILQSKGLDPALPEAPEGEQLQTIRESDGKEFGSRFDFDAGDTIALKAKITPASSKAGTAAIYHIRQYEKGKLIGGVCHIALY